MSWDKMNPRVGLALALGMGFAGGCLKPGEIDDPAPFLERLDEGGTSMDSDAGPMMMTQAGSTAQPMESACDKVVTDLFTASCTASVCHGMGSTNALNLDEPGLPGRLVGMKGTGSCSDGLYIDPAEPEKSLLVEKLKPMPCGSPMPLGGNPATAAQQACVLEWVTKAAMESGGAAAGQDSGTPNNNNDAGNSSTPNNMMDAGSMNPACQTGDEDSDGDGTIDCDDECPADPTHDAEPCDVPGLLVGTLAGNPNNDDPNPGDLGVDPLGPTKTETRDWPEDTTFVLTGKVYVSDSGAISFFENIDDGVHLEVDGQVLLDDGQWDLPTSGTLMREEGWYDFDLRISNGMTDSGPSNNSPIGFGYAPMDTAGSTDPADYTHPKNSDAQTADLFLTTEP